MAGIEDIAKHRGFFWQASEIYGGLAGFYDYGHLGTLMKRKWEALWRSYFLSLGGNFYEIDACTIMPESVLIASGHVKNFVDPLVKCKKCGFSERADHILEEELKENFEGMQPEELTKIIKKHGIRCPKCKGSFESAGMLNIMFPLSVGTGSSAYLRPETAQSAYVNFLRCFEQLRRQLPLGLAIVGRAFRNEISPRSALIRMREFTQAELQIFFDPDRIDKHEKFSKVEDYRLRVASDNGKADVTCRELAKQLPEYYVYHMAKVQQFYLDVLQLPAHAFRFRELGNEERAFYNKYHWDIELLLGSWREVGGIHYRTDHDLSGHQKASKKDMSVNTDGKKFIPHVLELSFGVDRNLYALFELFFREEEVKKEQTGDAKHRQADSRAIFAFPRMLCPFDAAIFPLVSKDNLPGKALEINKMLKKFYAVFYDETGSIGRRYRRADEVGTPLCITVDHQTLEDNSVTLRDRDSMKQVRVGVDELCSALHKFLSGEGIEKLGKAQA